MTEIMATSDALTQLGHDSATGAFFETLFALSNGTLGLRPTVDHDCPRAIAGAFHSALYAPSLTVRREIVNLPNWGALEIPGTRLRSFERRLGYGDAILVSEADLEGPGGLVLRLHRNDCVDAARADQSLCWGEIEVLEGCGRFSLQALVDARHGNAYGGGFSRAIRTHHCAMEPPEISRAGGLRWSGTVRGTGAPITIQSRLSAPGAATWHAHASLGQAGEAVGFDAAPGATFAFSRLTRVSTALPGTMPEPLPSPEALPDLLRRHRAAWSRRWAHLDCAVEGDPEADARLQFSRFHLLQSMPDGVDEANIPARGLTSEYHSGHFFFNTEVFKLPVFLLTEPDRAQALLAHRAARLDAARHHASETGGAGARFPEEADPDGAPSAPFEIRDVHRERTITEWSGPQTKFISALVALAADWVRQATGTQDPASRLIEDTASYGASLLQQGGDGLAIAGVMCADEYHYDVTNNVFTNELVRHNLRLAADLPGADGRFATLADAIRAPRPMAAGALAQFDGYEELPDAQITSRDANGRPVMTPEIRAAADDLLNFDSKLIKEGDVVFVHDLLPQLFPAEQHRRDFDFYYPRTTMESSLSATPYAIVAARLGLAGLAQGLFRLTAGFNLDYQPREDYRNGIHIAACAGAWRILVAGFLGQNFSGDALDLAPHDLPPGWQALRLRLVWRGLEIGLRYDGRCLSLTPAAAGQPVELRVTDAGGTRMFALAPGQSLSIDVDPPSSSAINGGP